MQEGRWGYIDETGNVRIKPRFRMALDFSEGLAPVVVGKKFGYINERGVVVIGPQFEEAYDFSEGLAVVSKDYRWGYIDKRGDLPFPCSLLRRGAFLKV